jgi:hypothetical protein
LVDGHHGVEGRHGGRRSVDGGGRHGQRFYVGIGRVLGG